MQQVIQKRNAADSLPECYELNEDEAIQARDSQSGSETSDQGVTIQI